MPSGKRKAGPKRIRLRKVLQPVKIQETARTEGDNQTSNGEDEIWSNDSSDASPSPPAFLNLGTISGHSESDGESLPEACDLLAELMTEARARNLVS